MLGEAITRLFALIGNLRQLYQLGALRSLTFQGFNYGVYEQYTNNEEVEVSAHIVETFGTFQTSPPFTF